MIDAPYPDDLAAKGWSLDLDYERIEQSDTWAIASPEQRPWLLMLWLMSWRQVPIASLPNDDRLIAARIGMPLERFVEWRDVLLSGWSLATNGRLYHATLTKVALKMASKRDKDRTRVANFRAKHQRTSEDSADVTRYTDVTNTNVRVSSSPSPSPSPIEVRESAPAAPSPSSDRPTEKPARPSRRVSAGRLKSLSDYLVECRDAGVKPIPDDHYIRRYCSDVGIEPDMLILAWLRFREEHTVGRRKTKKYIDWPDAFSNSVKDRWYRLWMVNSDGPASWTSEGLQARRAEEAKSTNQEEQHEPA